MFNRALAIIVLLALYSQSQAQILQQLQNSTQHQQPQNVTLQKLVTNTTQQLLLNATQAPQNTAKSELMNATQLSMNATQQQHLPNATQIQHPQNTTKLQQQLQNATLQYPLQNTTLKQQVQNSTLQQQQPQNFTIQQQTQNSTQLKAQNSTQLQEPQHNENSARLLMEEINGVYWASATVYRQFGEDTLSPQILRREKLRPYFRKLEQYDWRSFKDPLLRRQFEVILRGAKYPPLNYKFKKATNILKMMSQQKYVCQMEDRNKCNQAFVHHIKTVMASSNDMDELKYYWKEWRNKMPLEVKQALLYYVQYYQNMSTPELSASSIWYDQYEDPHFIDELEELMQQILPFYRELHTHLRYILIQKYGPNVVSPNGLIPHHLLEQATYQAWKKSSVLPNPFPLEKLPNLQAELDAADLYPFDLVNISARFFGSLGMQNLTEEFMRDHFIEMEPGTGGPDCKSRIFDYAEIELHYCPKVYYKKLLQTHGDISQVEYALAKNNLSVGLNQEACPGFGNALGEAVILSVQTPDHLQKRLKLLKDYEYDDFRNVNRLYRMAIHTLLTIPTYFVHEKLWIDMIEGKIGPSNYSCHYWNLMQKYMGVEAPLKTDANAYDMPYKFYESLVDQYRGTKKLFGEILGYQIYRALCLNTGQYESGNAYKELNSCDFATEKTAGKLFLEMMSLGSTKPWRDVIKPLTEEKQTKLSASAFLEYFGPVHTWIAEDNASRKLKVGWTTMDKCSPVATR